MFYLSKWRFGRNRQHAHHAVDMIVAQARQPDLYLAGGVRDDVPGRVEAVLLHLCLVVHALRGQPGARSFIAELYRLVFRHHLDPAMRELAVGDLSVPKQMRRIAEGIHGRGMAYAEGLAAAESGDNNRLAAALARNFAPPLGGAETVPEPVDMPAWLVDYVLHQARHLEKLAGAGQVMQAGWAFAPVVSPKQEKPEQEKPEQEKIASIS